MTGSSRLTTRTPPWEVGSPTSHFRERTAGWSSRSAAPEHVLVGAPSTSGTGFWSDVGPPWTRRSKQSQKQRSVIRSGARTWASGSTAEPEASSAHGGTCDQQQCPRSAGSVARNSSTACSSRWRAVARSPTRCGRPSGARRPRPARRAPSFPSGARPSATRHPYRLRPGDRAAPRMASSSRRRSFAACPPRLCSPPPPSAGGRPSPSCIPRSSTPSRPARPRRWPRSWSSTRCTAWRPLRASASSPIST